MGKRKVSVFTVAESVSHWLEANCRIPVLTTTTKEEPVQVDIARGIAAHSRLTPAIARPAEADRPIPLPVQLASDPCYRLTGSPRGELPAEVAVPPGTSEAGIPLGQPLEELDTGSEAAIEAFWALLAELGYEPL